MPKLQGKVCTCGQEGIPATRLTCYVEGALGNPKPGSLGRGASSSASPTTPSQLAPSTSHPEDAAEHTAHNSTNIPQNRPTTQPARSSRGRAPRQLRGIACSHERDLLQWNPLDAIQSTRSHGSNHPFSPRRSTKSRSRLHTAIAHQQHQLHRGSLTSSHNEMNEQNNKASEIYFQERKDHQE